MNHQHGFRIGLDEILYVYTSKRHNLGKYYFVADARLLQLVVNLLDTSKNKPQGNVKYSAHGVVPRTPMLKEYKINMDPKSSRHVVPGPRPFLSSILIFLFPDLLDCGVLSGSWKAGG